MTTPDGRESRRHPDEQELAHAVHASDALRQLLAAASAPPSKAELKGRSRAVAAFRAAYRLRRPAAADPAAPAGEIRAAASTGAEQARTENLAGVESSPGEEGRAPAGARRRARLARARRWSAAQLTLAGAALLMLLGATAAAAGQLPAPLQETVTGLFSGSEPAGHDSTPAPPGPSVRPQPPVPSRSAHPPPPAATGGPSVPARSAGRTDDGAAAQLPGLCQAYRAAGPRRAPLSAPGFQPLVRAAGGTSEVAGYCAALPDRGRSVPPATAARPSKVEPPGSTPGQAGSHSRSHPTTSQAGSAAARPRSAPPLPAAHQASGGPGHPRG